MEMIRNKYLYLLILSLPLFSLCYGEEKPPYPNTSLSFEKRTEDLLSRLTLEEKVKSTQIQFGGNRTFRNPHTQFLE
jgi:hypothetical protein